MVASLLAAKHLHKERYYQKEFCKGERGIEEFKLSDGSRVDCLTATHAIEVDFAEKWAESIGQSLYYAYMTGKRPGVYIIVESDKDYKYINRLKPMAKKYGIDVYRSDL